MTKTKDINRYPKPSWATHQVIRMDGRVDDICEHGVGHPNKAWLKEHDRFNLKQLGIHCCDACCFEGDD